MKIPLGGRASPHSSSADRELAVEGGTPSLPGKPDAQCRWTSLTDHSVNETALYKLVIPAQAGIRKIALDSGQDRLFSLNIFSLPSQPKARTSAARDPKVSMVFRKGVLRT